jgi:sugar O-acyltransferase (sialic acid O-acetyltransferase NeuD family)
VKVLVIGGAAHGRQVIDAAEAGGEHTIVGVLDRALASGSTVGGHRVLGADDHVRDAAAVAGANGFVVAVGDNFARRAVVERALADAPALELATVVHPAAVVARDAVIGAGTVLLAGSVVANGCTLGRGVLLGTRASIDHDGTVGEFASLGPGATTGGDVRVGEVSAVGLGADVVHGVAIGGHTVIGAGALVLADVPDRVVAYGVPARVVRAREPGEPYLRRS